MFGHRYCEIRAVSAVACSSVWLFSLLSLHLLSLSLSCTHRRGDTAGSRPASLRARVSKPFKFRARSTAPNSLLPLPPAQPEVISLFLRPFPVPLTNSFPIAFHHRPSSSHQRETESLLPAYLFRTPPSSPWPPFPLLYSWQYRKSALRPSFYLDIPLSQSQSIDYLSFSFSKASLFLSFPSALSFPPTSCSNSVALTLFCGFFFFPSLLYSLPLTLCFRSIFRPARSSFRPSHKCFIPLGSNLGGVR